MSINIDSTKESIQKINNNKSIIWNSIWSSKYSCHIGLFFVLKIVIYFIYFTNNIYIDNNAVGIISPNSDHSTDSIDPFDDFMDIIRKPTPPRLPPSPVQKGIAQNILSYFKLV